MSRDTREAIDTIERPRPSRKKRRRKRVLGMFPRLMLSAILVGFTIVVCVAMITKIIQPYQMSHDQSKQMSALSQQLADTESQSADLQKKVSYLRRPDGIEAAARAQGYLKPGEISLIIENPPASSAP